MATHEAGRKLGGLDVEILELAGVVEVLFAGGHQRRPFAVEVDEKKFEYSRAPSADLSSFSTG